MTNMGAWRKGDSKSYYSFLFRVVKLDGWWRWRTSWQVFTQRHSTGIVSQSLSERYLQLIDICLKCTFLHIMVPLIFTCGEADMS